MLTVDLERLEVGAHERLLDLGCGGGRHAFAAARTGACVVALDTSHEEVEGVRAMLAAMADAGEIPSGAPASGALCADARSLPFEDASFDRVIASEVLEHVVDDVTAIAELVRVLRPGGTMAVTVPRLGPEVVNWLLSDAYHDVPGGHIRIYRHKTLARRLAEGGLVVGDSHHAHGLHTPYWWLRCVVGPSDEAHWAVALYHRFLVWDIVRRPALTRALDWVLNPLWGKSLVLYARKPLQGGRP